MQINRFEHPLNEKVRIYLRLEYLLKQMDHARQLSDEWQHQVFFRALFDILEILEQIQLKAELAKDLDKLRHKLNKWADIDGVDKTALDSVQGQITEIHKRLLQSGPRLGESLRSDRFLSSIKHRFSIPGGSCCFDLPTLHHWLHFPLAHKQSDMRNWLDELSVLKMALDIWLSLNRESGQFADFQAKNGHFQHEADNCELLRLEICHSAGVYPMISGHRNRFSIRFLPFEEGAPTADTLDFRLALC